MHADADLEALEAATLRDLMVQGAALAADLQARALAAESSDEAARLAGAWHKVGRSVRQTIALSRRARRDASVAEQAVRAAAVERRKAHLAATLRYEIWCEHEGLEAEELDDHLDELLGIDSLDEGFTDEDFQAQLVRLRPDLKLRPKSGPEAESDPPPEADPPPENDAWRSSA